MSDWLSAEVPFVTVGNRRALTDQSVVEDPYLEQFLKMFKHCFERDLVRDVWLLIEKDDE